MSDAQTQTQREREQESKRAIRKQYDSSFLNELTRAAIAYDVDSSYLQTVWTKGEALAYFLDKCGFKIERK